MSTIEILAMNDFEIKFVLKDSFVAFANALRRIIISEIPIFAIDQILIEHNSSTIPDEVIAHRIGLIPLSLNPIASNTSCTCTYECPKCTIKFECDIKSDDDNFELNSNHIVPNKRWNPDPIITPLSFDILGQSKPIHLFKLKKGERIKFKADARLGIGRQHAKWSPVSIATFEQMKENGDIIFTMESNGVLSSKEILNQAFNILNRKLYKLEKLLMSSP